MSIPIEDMNNEAAAAPEGAEAAAEPEVVEAEIIEPEEETAEAAEAAEAEAPAEEAKSEEDLIMAEAEAAVAAAEALDAAKAELAEANEKYLRLHAEWDTYRRRMNEQREEDKKRATEKLVDNLIPVIDDFERTIDYGSKNDGAGMLDGTKAVYNKLVDTLTKSGVEVINPEGQAFNALEAQAVQMVDDPSVPDETVSMVFQKGYKMGSKVLRPAMVVVTTGGPKREAEEE